MGFKINFDAESVATNEFKIEEDGKYDATSTEAEKKEWNEQYSIGFDVEIRSDVEQKHQGAKILYNTLYLTAMNPEYQESTMKKVNSFLAACGYTGKQELDLDTVVNEVIGKTVLVYVKHKTDNNGKTWAKVAFVAPSNVPSPQQSAPFEPSDEGWPF